MLNVAFILEKEFHMQNTEQVRPWDWDPSLRERLTSLDQTRACTTRLSTILELGLNPAQEHHPGKRNCICIDSSHSHSLKGHTLFLLDIGPGEQWPPPPLLSM